MACHTVLAALAVSSGPPRDVFTSGREGYHTYRIPSMVTMPQTGHLLLFAEGRKESGADHGFVDIVMKRSVDGGASWGGLELVHSESRPGHPVTIGNPSPIAVHSVLGMVVLVFCRNNQEVLQLVSHDSGTSWTGPVNITSSVKLPSWTWVATGPPSGLQLASGRLIVAADHISNRDGWASHAMLSDDLGVSWKLSNSMVGLGGNECQAAICANGSLLMNQRTHSNIRQFSWSHDDGATWTAPRSDVFNDGVKYGGGGCEGSTIALSTGELVFSTPFAPGRENMSVFMSTDSGASWNLAAHIDSGPSAYSSLAPLPGRSAALVYEAGNYASLRFVALNFSQNTLTERGLSQLQNSCNNNNDCEMNGHCTSLPSPVSNPKQCICSPGWMGPTCGQLKLAPVANLSAATVWPRHRIESNVSSWGFSAVEGDDGRFYAVVNVGCGPTATSVTGTHVALVSSSMPDKGFTFDRVLVPATSFNPHMIRSPNGTYLLYFRVNDLDAHKVCNGDSMMSNQPPAISPCKSDQSPLTDSCVVPGSPNGPGINMYVAWADNPIGPWKSRSVQIKGCGNYHKSNPTTTYLKDGKVFLSFRFNPPGGERVGFAIADDFRGPFVSMANLSHERGNDEDSFAWQDADGTIHILYHNEQHGLHAWSSDTITWFKGKGDAFGLTYKLENGETGTFHRRERPELLFDATNNPKYFYTAVETEDRHSLSFVQTVLH